ncbi:uncharacterized protein LOC105222304 [Bactrocera dorsalis]|uniref:Uncharacterized protein LOC105222304 n=1 Tax=Bactrocera dorsalis TaxID=27457 RepID=A0A6I9UUF8_BACDO|nr:uncharacterized protein LOC105222304 [Bactrocera dorsalis]XP_019844571.2 uncharacterized protein LOC105222304 [Bactrocera dorsalis]
MGDYKLLNKELVDANRELKQTIATYQNELILTRAELMEQHRIRVEGEREYRDRVLSLVAHNFMALMRDIDANVNVQEFLGCNSCGQNSNYTNGVSAKSDSASSRRRSTHLVREFRRSSAVTRQNSIQLSPTRRPYESHAIIEQTETSKLEESESGSDMDLENSITEDNVIDVEREESYENADLHCIKEASEEECEENDDGKKCTVVYKRNRQPVRDVANIHMEQIENKGYYVTKREKERNRRSDKENSIEVPRNVEVDGMEVEDDLIQAMNQSLHVSDSKITDNNDKWKEIIKENFKRHVVVKVKRMHEPQPAVAHFNTEEHTLMPEYEISVEKIRNDELSLGISQFSMGNFLEASCSTPCHGMKAAMAEATTDETECDGSCSVSSQTTSLCVRPSRRCAPTTLAEPSLRVKLRSDSGKRKGSTKKR